MESNTTAVKALKAHLALNVRNVPASTEFYRKMLGIDPSKVRSGYAKFDVQNPPLNLSLNEVAFGERGALSHLGIQVASTEDVAAMRAKWVAAGLVTRDEMQTNCCTDFLASLLTECFPAGSDDRASLCDAPAFLRDPSCDLS